MSTHVFNAADFGPEWERKCRGTLIFLPALMRDPLEMNRKDAALKGPFGFHNDWDNKGLVRLQAKVFKELG